MVNIKLVFETSSNEPKVKEGRLEEPEVCWMRILTTTALSTVSTHNYSAGLPNHEDIVYYQQRSCIQSAEQFRSYAALKPRGSILRVKKGRFEEPNECELH